MKRKQFGDGSVYYRHQEQRWVAVLRLRNGKRKAIYGQTEREARRKRKEASERDAQGRVAVPTKRTFKAAADAWLKQCEFTSKMSAKSRKTYADVLRLHVVPVIGNTRIESASPSIAAEVLRTMADAGYSPSYQGQAHKAMSHVFQYALREGWVRKNPCRDVVKPSGNVKERVVPDALTVQRFINEAPDERIRTFVTIAAYTGLRIGEILNLRWGDIDLGEGVLHVRSGKGGKARALTVTASVAAQLRTWRTTQRRERRKATWWASDEEWVISTSVGTRFDVQNFRSKHFNPLRDTIAPGVTPHSFRHGLATRLLEAGVPMRVVAEQLGHSSTRITEDVYTHVTPGLSRAAAEAIEDVYGRYKQA